MTEPSETNREHEPQSVSPGRRRVWLVVGVLLVLTAAAGWLFLRRPPQAEPGSEAVASRAASAVVSTPSARNHVASETSAAIRVAAAGNSDTRVFEGRSDVETNKGNKVSLARREGLRVDAAGQAGDKIPLPEAPVLLAPPDAADLAYPNPARSSTELRWSSLPGATNYHVVVDSSAYFNDPVVDHPRIQETRASASGLGTGRFFWKVAAVGDGGLEGSYSNFARFTIVQGGVGTADAAAAALVVEGLERRGNIVLIKGRSQVGSRVTVNGIPLAVGSGGSFHEHLPIDASVGSIVIRAASPSGGITEQRRTVPAAN